MLSDDWWFWVLTAIVAAVSASGSARYRAAAAGARSLALRRGLVDPGPGRRVIIDAGGFWSELSWLSLLLGAWVVLGPWIWGYEGVDGAVASDAITGSAVVTFTLLGIVFPSMSALNVLGGLWLVVAPWLIGYGGEGGPVGLSDALAGIAIAALAIAGMAPAARRVAPGGPGPIGRVRR